MFTAQGLQRTWRWVPSRLVSLFPTGALSSRRDNGSCHSLLVQSGHRRPPKCLKVESGCRGIISIGYSSTSRAPSLTVVLLRDLLPRSLELELEPRAYYWMEPSSHTAEPASGFGRHLWEVSQKEAYCALYHPFVVALAGDTLHTNTFEAYIAQDYYFLAAFAEAYGLAIENTDDQEAKVILQGLKTHVQHELDQVHVPVATAQSSGLKLMKATRPNPATTAYTDFLLRVAKGEKEVLHSFADLDAVNQEVNSSSNNSEIVLSRRRKMAAYTIAAMTPCARLYAFLGYEIKKSLKGDTNSSSYSQWIETYASTEFESTAVQSEHLVQRLAMPFPGEFDTNTMERLYRRAMELEVGFFTGQQPLSTNGPILVPLFLSEMASNSHFIFLSDFDSTCTVSDSCPALADLSISTLEKQVAAGGHANGPISSSVKSLRSRWDSLVDQYAQGYTDSLDRVLSTVGGSVRESQERPFDLGKVRQVSEELAKFEITANARVVDFGVLKGLNKADVNQAGGGILLREGCESLLKRISQDGLPVEFHILSVCWSRSFIEGSFSKNGLQFANIHSNELQFDDRGISTGNIVRRLQTAVDKEKDFVDILNRTEEKVDAAKAFTVYVGDSLTDLLCLLKADIGIVIGKSSSLERVAEACGVTFVPLYSGLLKQQRNLARGDGEVVTWTKVDGVLYRVSSWHELHAFLLGS